MVRVQAFTAKGILGESTEEILVHTKPDLDLPGPPEHLTVIPTSPTTLNVSWSPPSQSQTKVTNYVLYFMQVSEIFTY